MLSSMLKWRGWGESWPSGKDALLEKTKEELTKDTDNSYMMGFDDVVAQVTCVYSELDLSKIGLGKVVVDGQLVDEE